MSTIKVANINPVNAGETVNINSIAMPSAGSLANRNLIINGDMRIAQRGNSLTGPSDGSYLVDRWINYTTKSNVAVAQNTATGLTGFPASLKWTRTSSGSIGSNAYIALSQKIEGVNTAQLEYGTANAKTVTISFWVKSNITGNYALTIRNDVSTQTDISYTTLYNVPSTSWNYIEVTIPGPTTGSWLGSTTAVGMEILWGLDVGTNFHASSADTWTISPSKFGLGTASNNWANGTNNTFEITGVQLEVGSTTTTFEYRNYGDELFRCQRYFVSADWQFCTNVTGTTARFIVPGPGVVQRIPADVSYFNPSTGTANQVIEHSTGSAFTVNLSNDMTSNIATASQFLQTSANTAYDVQVRTYYDAEL